MNTFGQKKFRISCTGSKVPFWQFFNFSKMALLIELVHEIQNFFWPKVFFWSIMKVPFRKNIHNMPQGPPNPGFMQEKVQKGDFLKKPSRELKFFGCFRFLWISQRPGTLNLKWLVFWPSKNLYNQCDQVELRGSCPFPPDPRGPSGSERPVRHSVQDTR